MTAKVNSSFEMRRKHAELEADMSSKLADVSEISVISTEVFLIHNFFYLFFALVMYDLMLMPSGREAIE